MRKSLAVPNWLSRIVSKRTQALDVIPIGILCRFAISADDRVSRLLGINRKVKAFCSGL